MWGRERSVALESETPLGRQPQEEQQQPQDLQQQPQDPQQQKEPQLQEDQKTHTPLFDYPSLTTKYKLCRKCSNRCYFSSCKGGFVDLKVFLCSECLSYNMTIHGEPYKPMFQKYHK